MSADDSNTSVFSLTQFKLESVEGRAAGRCTLLLCELLTPFPYKRPLRLGWEDSSSAQACPTATDILNTFSVIPVLLRWYLYGFPTQSLLLLI